MTKPKVRSKGDLVNEIMELLDVDNSDKTELSENLNKMSKTAISTLLYYLDEFTEEPMDEEETEKPEAPKRVEAKPPELFMPQDINIPKNPTEMGSLLNFLPEIGRRVQSAWRNGDFPLLKRNIGVNDRIIRFCEQMVAKQLWDAIKVYPQNEEKKE